MPVRASPLPPLASPGFPVVFTQISPRWSAISARQPLRTKITWCSRANLRATSMRFASISLTVLPIRRAISPGCGVSTRGRLLPSSNLLSPSNALSASASTTNGRGQRTTNLRTARTVSASRLKPGPTATTFFRWSNADVSGSSRARSEIAPAAFSSRGSVINSGIAPATTGCMLFGTAQVTSPAPVRKAAIEAMVGAPDFPTEPPITRV